MFSEVAISNNQPKMLSKEPTKFVSFLDEVDRKMAKNRKTKSNLSSLYSNSEDEHEWKNNVHRDSVTLSSHSTTKYILENDGPILPQLDKRPERDLANAYDRDLFQQYKDVLTEHVLASPKFIKAGRNMDGFQSVCEWLLSDYVQVEHYLPLLHINIPGERNEGNEHIKTHPRGTAFRQQLQDQNIKFLAFKRCTSDQLTLATAALTALSRYCAKRNQVVPLIVAWEKVKEGGIVLSEEESSTFLYVFGSSSALYSTMLLGSSRVADLLLQNYGTAVPSNNRPSSHSSVSEILTGSNFAASQASTDFTSSETSTTSNYPSREKRTNIPAEVATYHDLLYEPTERSISIRVKALVAKGDAHGAQKLLDSFPVSMKFSTNNLK